MKMKKTILYFTASLMMLYILPACKHTKEVTPVVPLTGSWTAGVDFEGIARSNAVAFTINNKAYVGTGFSGTTRLKDFWEFDGTTWSQKAIFPGIAREKAAGFALSTKGYLGTGFDGTNLLKDFYEYDPIGNSWTKKKDFADSLTRSSAVGFALDSNGVGLGFIGTGFDGNSKNDIYKYHSLTDKWYKVASLPKKTSSASAFVINNKAYVCAGTNNGIMVNEVSEYDPTNNTWAVKATLPSTRSDAVGFSLNELGYLAGGFNGSSITASVWSFNPGAVGTGGTWTQVNDMGGSARMNAVGFVFNNKAFVATGKNNNARFDDVWQLNP
jgi:N-acetylneuraminic acid mutarotase